MSEQAPGSGAGRAIARRDFEAIIRRAAELTLADADAGDLLTEDEVLRIASELGLPAHHVRQALYELPAITAAPHWYDRWFERGVVADTRAVPLRADQLRRRVEDYLATHEYLQVVRRRPEETVFAPAEDALSRVARVFARPSSRFGLAHAERVVVAVHALPDQRSHIRVETDLQQERSRAAVSGVLWGGFLGLITGGGLATGAILVATGATEAVLAAGGLITSVAAGLTIGVKAEASRFRARVTRVQGELAHLLDRAESGQSLEPPPAPWRRSLQAKLFGPRS